MITQEQMQDNERKKAYLRSYKDVVKRMKILQDEIDELRMSKCSPSVVYDDMPHAHNHSDLSDYAVKLDDLERKLIQERYKRLEIKTNVLLSIENMESEREKNLLTLRYIRCMSLESIAVELNYTWRHINRIHSKALNNFEIKSKPMGGIL